MLMASNVDLAFAAVRSHPYLGAAGAFIIYLFSLAIYRLYFHPLSHIPGPPLAIVTKWGPEFYYDVICQGRFQNQFPRWHKKYGPLIRTSADELHCIDPAFIDTIYPSGATNKKRDKPIFYLNAFQLWDSTFGAITHDEHRQRRSFMNPFFSKASVTKLEGSIRRYIDRVCNHIASYANTGEVCNLSKAYICLSTDVITSYSFGWDRGYSQNRDFEPNLLLAMRGGLDGVHLFRHFPLLLPLLEKRLPESIAARLIEGGAEYFQFQRQVFATADEVVDGKIEMKSNEGPKTIFKDILEGSSPEREKRRQRLREGAREIIGAGALTTASALTFASYYLLANPDSMEKLYAELCTAIPDPSIIPPSIVLEQLPYLNAVLHEALRFSCGLSSRLPRVPHEPLIYTTSTPSTYNPTGKTFTYKLPARTIISMSTYLMHSNPDTFPEPEKWKPERWLDAEGKRNKAMDGYLLSFSKGSRQCLGINLAWVELHLTLATLIRRLGPRMQLHQTGPEEVEYTHDAFEVGRASYKGVRVTVR